MKTKTIFLLVASIFTGCSYSTKITSTKSDPTENIKSNFDIGNEIHLDDNHGFVYDYNLDTFTVEKGEVYQKGKAT